MTDKIEVETRFNKDVIETSTMFHHGLRYDDIMVKVIKLQEQGVISALKHLGWTPPNDSPKIKMTKTLPSDACDYYHSHYIGETPSIVSVYRMFDSSLAVEHEGPYIRTVEEFGGYWAKVEQSHFEFEG